MRRLLDRIELALRELDLGISHMLFREDFLAAVNQGLREVGSAQLQDLKDEGALLRAALGLEAAL
jgi:hypothetical protein